MHAVEHPRIAAPAILVTLDVHDQYMCMTHIYIYESYTIYIGGDLRAAPVTLVVLGVHYPYIYIFGMYVHVIYHMHIYTYAYQQAII